MSIRILKWALIGLVAANVLVAAAWWAKDDLVKAGLLSAPPQRVDLGERLLPSIVVVNAEEEAASAAPPAPSPPDPAAARQSDPRPPTQPDPVVTPQADPLATPAPPEAEQAPTVLACIVAGPFRDKPSAEATATRMAAAGGSAQVEAETVTAIRAYLVYVAPTDGRAAARAHGELTERGIDAFVIPSGARQNGVSVGVFSSQERAMAQRDRIAALGHSVLIHPLERVATVYRVAGRNVPSAEVADLAVTPCEDAETP